VLRLLQVGNFSRAHGGVVTPYNAHAFALAQRVNYNARGLHDGRAADVEVAHWHRLLEAAVAAAKEQSKHGAVGVLRSVQVGGLGGG
jgi:hypothetical protein